MSMKNNNVHDILSHNSLEANHSNSNFYFRKNQIDGNIQRIKECFTTFTTNQPVERNQTTDTFDLLLNNDQRKSLDLYDIDVSSQISQFEQLAVDNDPAPHSNNDTNVSDIYRYNSNRNELFNDNLAPSLPKPNQTFSSNETIDPSHFNIEYEENYYHRSLHSEAILRPMFVSDSQQLRLFFTQLQPSFQQEIQIIPNDLTKQMFRNAGTKPRIPNNPFSSQLIAMNYYDDDRNDVMSYSWNTINHLLGPIKRAQQTIPLYCWEDQVITSSNPPQLETSLHFTTNCYLKQVPSRKHALQVDMSSEISFNASNHFMSQRTETFVEIQDNFVSDTLKPSVDLNDLRTNAQPRKQRLRYPGDMYTPQWVRYSGHAKEGYCDNCKPGKWYHKQFFHGISSVSGKTFVSPIETRKFHDNCIERLCHQCGQWVPIAATRKKSSMLWFRHAHKCHVYIKPKNCLPRSKEC
ncbi:19919_t:CDS:2 [Funneliformis geosporum]|uniref:19919_t:CDS:1 n=1 Tax=Funneliformis geosporum TaxID=1117311 RepID=A0A9W4WXR3_9GLOM|nr:19919_t:CDS:2 [Funneliformis geosporum]